MRNIENDLKLVRKISDILMKIGEIHANELSFGFGMYEPKISMDILENSSEDKK